MLLLVYACSTTTTTLPCLAVVLATPTTSADTLAAKLISITSAQRWLLITSYLPFFLIPLVMAVDAALRLSKLVKAGIHAQASASKAKQL